MPASSSSSSPSVSRPSSSHHRLNKLSISTVDKLSIVGDKIPDYIPGFKTSAGTTFHHPKTVGWLVRLR
jgi:hypothetical protein